MADGTKKYLVDTPLYEAVYQGKTVEKQFTTLQKHLFKEKTGITSHQMSRRIRPSSEYKLYN